MTKHIASELPAASAITGDELVVISQLDATITITASTISALAADNSYNDSANGFVAAGFAVGQRVHVDGFTGDVANNIFVGIITALAAGKMTIGGTDGDVIVNDAAGESVTISKWTTSRVTADDLVSGITDALGILKHAGDLDCSANPNYPAADNGDVYYVTVAGKIGGAAGKDVDVGDTVIAKADNAGGTEAAVGTSWYVLEHNLAGVAMLSGATFTGDIIVPADAYGAGWNGSNEAPTKNDVYDKIEAIVAGIPGSYTDEMAQDAVGAMVVDTATVNVTYTDATPELKWDVIDSAIKPTEFLEIALSDETTAITTGDGKASWGFGYDFTIDEIYILHGAAVGSSGLTTVDVNKNGSTILTTKASIGNGQRTSLSGSGSVAAVILTATSTKGDYFSADVDAAATGAKGLKLLIIGHRT